MRGKGKWGGEMIDWAPAAVFAGALVLFLATGCRDCRLLDLAGGDITGDVEEIEARGANVNSPDGRVDNSVTEEIAEEEAK